MSTTLRSAIALAAALMAAQAGAQVTFYENDGYQGRSFTADRQVENFNSYGFNDRASSIVIQRGSWEVCQDAGFNGRCVVLRQGSYASLAPMGLNDRISSARAVGGRDNVPRPVESADYRRRGNEKLFEANVTSVRAVVATPERRCWVEREAVNNDRGRANVGGAVVGALLGGILGHQIGGGTGRDIATVGGAVAGGAVGAQVGRDNNNGGTQNVQRCTDTAASGRPEYWDVTYTFRGQEHRMQMSSPPGATVLVNRNGEPRA